MKVILLIALQTLLTKAYQVQEEEIMFYLYTRNQTLLQITPKSICNIDFSKDLKFLIHGWIASHNEPWMALLTEAYLKIGDFNVVHVDWSQLAAQSAEVATENANNAAYYVSKLIGSLIKQGSLSPSRIEIAGHSLGAHISGFVGKFIAESFNEKVKMIIGMDPPKLNFEGSNGIEKGDADIVNIIHTDIEGSNNKQIFGDVDFFPNGGHAPQPGCPEDSDCSHVIATAFFIEAIENPEAFISVNCDSYENYLTGLCDENETITLGGNLEGIEGSFYFETNPQKPYSKN